MMHGYTKYILTAVLVLLLLGIGFTLQRNFYEGFFDSVERVDESIQGEINSESINTFSPTIEGTIEKESMSSEEFARTFSLIPPAEVSIE